MDAHRKAALALADNLTRLMADRGLTQTALAKMSGVGQRTISTILDLDRSDDINPTISTIQAIADCFSVPAWQMLIPNMPVDLLSDRAFGQVVQAYRDASDEGRSSINRVADAEARYTRIRGQVQGK